MNSFNDMTVRDHMTPDRHSEGFKIMIAIQNCQDANSRLSRGLPDLSARIEANIHAVMERFDLTLGEWHLWCKAART
jgi:hypothetical protein